VLGAGLGGAAGYAVGNHLRNDRIEDQARPPAPVAPQPVAAPEPASATPAPRWAPPPAESPAITVGTAPGTPDAQTAALARAEYDAGRRATTAEEALRRYEAASRLDPTRPEPHNARGMILRWQGNEAEARRAFAQALAVDPSYAPARENLR
jgi:tetratricopeptide (TPR) repeat protein